MAIDWTSLRRFYLWLPHRRAVVAAGILAIAVTGLFAFMDSTPGTGSGPGGGDVKVARREARLVDQLLSEDWQAQKDATRRVLESIGVTVLDDDATMPAGKGLYVIQPELLMLAMDGARKRTTSRLSLAELAQMAKDFGFPFPEGQHPARVMEEGVRTWVGEALDNPRTPGANAALFLHAMAARQEPAIDLSSPHWMAEQYAMTNLELFVFNASVVNAFPDASATVASTRFDPANLLADLVFPRAHAAAGPSDACAAALDLYDNFQVFDSNKQNMQSIFGLGQSGASATDGGAKTLAKAAGALSTLFKLHKLMLLYTSAELRVTADQSFVHKPAYGEGGKEVVFTATAGVDEEKQREFAEKMKASSVARDVTDCLGRLGLPMPTDLGEIIKEAENWEVSWDLYGHSGRHATWSTSKNNFKSGNQRRAPLKAQEDGHAAADFIVDIEHEDHHEGDIITDYISAQATLHTDAMPGTEAVAAYTAALNSLKDGNKVAGLLGIAGTTVGLTGSLMTEVLGGWMQRILDPEVSYNVAVAYHQLRYPGYSYEGEVHVQISHFEQESKRSVSSGWDRGHGPGSSNLVHEKYKRYSSETTATEMASVRASLTRYTDYKHRAVWDLSGQATTAASYEFYDSTVGETGCAGLRGEGYTGKRSLNRNKWGSGSSSGPMTYSMKIEQDARGKNDVRISVRPTSIGGLVRLQEQLSEELGGGCEFLNRGQPSSHSRTEATVGPIGVGLPEAPTHVYTVDEPFPERISGSQAVMSEDGKTKAEWRWDLRRVEPVEDPTGVPGQ